VLVVSERVNIHTGEKKFLSFSFVRVCSGEEIVFRLQIKNIGLASDENFNANSRAAHISLRRVCSCEDLSQKSSRGVRVCALTVEKHSESVASTPTHCSRDKMQIFVAKSTTFFGLGSH